MQLTRMDLDGTGSPTGLVTKILKAEPRLPLPVPIEALAQQLDITDINDLTSESFEGALITDTTRSSGIILVNKAAVRGRRRFSIAHELGHFLMTTHKPPAGGFQCSRGDMRRWDGKDLSPAMKMEFEANEFAGLILMPPPMWREQTKRSRDPDLSQVLTLAKTFDVSKEASARSYALYHSEAVAVIVTRDGHVDRIYRNFTRFPALCVKQGDPVPTSSILFRASDTAKRISDMAGQTTEKRRSESYHLGTWGRGSHNYQEVRRAMLEPGDVRMLPYDEQQVFVTGTKPFRTKKIRFYEEPMFKARATDIRAGGSGPSQVGGPLVPQQHVNHDWVQ